MKDQKETLKVKTTPDAPQKPEKNAVEEEKNGFKDLGLPEPTRYNDWEVKGRCSDF